MRVLLVEPMRDHLNVALIEDGEAQAHSRVATFDAVRVMQRATRAAVFIEEGYRTQDVRTAAAEHGWHIVKKGEPKPETLNIPLPPIHAQA